MNIGVQINQGLEFHRRGSLEQAARVYEGILAFDPGQPDALHLLGLVALQRGNAGRAVELVGRAIAINPGAAAYHANQAEAFRLLGQLGRAEAAARTALRLQPSFPEAANTLGLIFLSRGEFVVAAEHFRAAIDSRPDFAMAHANLGNALRLQEDRTGALEHFRRAAVLDPNLALAHSNLGQLLLELKQWQDALHHCREAVRLRPDFAEGQSNLGNVLRELGNLQEAKACYAEALRLNPKLAMVHNNIGQILQEEGRLQEALAWYHQALQMMPEVARFHTNLASAMEELEQHDEAIASYQQALRFDPNYVEAINGLGWVRHELGHYEEAKGYYQKALTLRPDFAPAHCNLGTVLEELGDFAAAEAAFRQALAHDPRHAEAHAQLATLLKAKLPAADEARLEQLQTEPLLPDGKRCALHFAMAQVHDSRRDYAQAARHLELGNALDAAGRKLRGKGYDPAAHARFVDRIMAICSPEFFARTRAGGHVSRRPIFIFGLPRSGTTLVEQVLASHSQVYGAGELRLARLDFESLAGPPPVKSDGEEAALAALDQASPELIHQLAVHHLEGLTKEDASALRVADKMPDNYIYVGLLAAMFPNAAFIHCTRDLRDVAVSAWITHFRFIGWACDPAHIAERFRQYCRLMDHWRRVLPVPMVEVAYEDMVTDLEGQARRLLACTGLDWEPACLEFHDTRRPVRTASVTQVRQPIYSRSVARWKNYAEALGPLFARLTEFVESSGEAQAVPEPAFISEAANRKREG